MKRQPQEPQYKTIKHQKKIRFVQKPRWCKSGVSILWGICSRVQKGKQAKNQVLPKTLVLRPDKQ
jgi:hypothetical protein